MTTIFGIKNCDTVKKARAWLDKQDIEYSFHDVRADGLNFQQVQNWIEKLGVDQVVNKRSTTWKQLSSDDQNRALSSNAAPVILANPTLVKRPVLEQGDDIYVGFSEEQYSSIFSD